jgi:formimidoylglutamate deiminase
MLIESRGNYWKLPAFVTAHSHAFQRGLRGKAQRPGPSDSDDFWTWREAMYQLANSLTPESIYKIARIAYRELKSTGTYTVGEFHYVHHQADGTPYEQRTLMAEQMIQAAKDEGMRICLLRAIYHRAGHNKVAEGVQRRFCDDSLDDALRDVEALRKTYGSDPLVRIGIAPHSVRAVPPDWLRPLAEYASPRKIPVHMHVSEQPGEVMACVAETGLSPVCLLSEQQVLNDHFVAVHATHLQASEDEILGQANAWVCVCPTTERDLGDGHPDLDALRRNNIRICLGIDSHIQTNPFEEMRGLEQGERLRSLKRVTYRHTEPSLAEWLWTVSSHQGAQSLGFEDAGAYLEIAKDIPSLELVDNEHVLDALVFSSDPTTISIVTANDQRLSTNVYPPTFTRQQGCAKRTIPVSLSGNTAGMTREGYKKQQGGLVGNLLVPGTKSTACFHTAITSSFS